MGQGGGRARIGPISSPHGTYFMSQGEGILPSSSFAIKFSERSRNWRYGRSRRFSTCRIRFPARDRKLPGEGGVQRKS